MLQVKGVVVQFTMTVGDQSLLLFQFPVHVHVSYEAMIVNGVEGYVDLLVEQVITSKGGEVHGVGNERGGAGSHEGCCGEWPPIGDAIQVHVVSMDVMMVVDIVVVELDVVGVGLGSILESELLAIFDMVLKLVVVHSESCQFVGYTLLMFLIGGLICEGGGDLSRCFIRRVCDYLWGELAKWVLQSGRGRVGRGGGASQMVGQGQQLRGAVDSLS